MADVKLPAKTKSASPAVRKVAAKVEAPAKAAAPAAKPEPVAKAPEKAPAPAPVAAKVAAPAPKPAPVAAPKAPTPEAVAAPVTPATPAPAAVAPPVTTPAAKEETVMNTTSTIKDQAEKAQAQAKEFYADFNERAKGAVEKGQKIASELQDLSKGNVEAIVESAKIAAKGAEDIARYSFDYGRQTIEQANATAKELAGAKSPTEFFQIQSEASRKAVDAIVAESSKFAENYLKLWGEIVQPVSNRVAVAMDKVKVAA